MSDDTIYTNISSTEKADIALVKDESTRLWDIKIADDGDLLACGGFDSAILNDSLTEVRATDTEQPDPIKRGGWIGNETPDTNNYIVGSKLYFYYQSRAILKNKNGSVDALRNSLSKYVPKYLREVEVTGELSTSGIVVRVKLIRHSRQIDKFYFNLWELTGQSVTAS